MAAIEKIYGSTEQRRELKRSIRRMRIPGYTKRRLYCYFYPVGCSALASFPAWADQLLLKQPSVPIWVKGQIASSYVRLIES